jgi:hypothetical protein
MDITRSARPRARPSTCDASAAPVCCSTPSSSSATDTRNARESLKIVPSLGSLHYLPQDRATRARHDSCAGSATGGDDLVSQVPC